MAAARELTVRDPLCAVTYSVIALMQPSFPQRDDALASARRAMELDSASAMPRAVLAVTQLLAGNRDSAHALAIDAGYTPNTTPWIGLVLAKQQTESGGRSSLAKSRRCAAAIPLQRLRFALVALSAGDTTRVLDALERAARARESIGFMAPFGLPIYDALRRRPRLAAVVRAFGADPASFTALPGASRPLGLAEFRGRWAN